MKASEAIDRVFFGKGFSATKYMLRYIVAAGEDTRSEQLKTVSHYRDLADQEIASVVDANYTNFNASLGKFAGIANQLQGARRGLLEVEKRSMEGKSILTAKTKSLYDLLIQKHEAKKVIELIDDIEYIEKAPAKIHAALAKLKSMEAVEIYLRAFELVFSEKLVVFGAIGNMRNALMECKQTIEDYLVHSLETHLYLRDDFNKLKKSAVNTSVKLQLEQLDALSIPEIAQCILRLSREVEVCGALKNSLDIQFTNLLTRVSSFCQTATSNVVDKNMLTVKTKTSDFGNHPQTTMFHSYLSILLDVVYECLKRQANLSVCLQQGKKVSPYSFDEVVRKTFHVLEKWIIDYFGDSTPTKSTPLSLTSTEVPNGLFRFTSSEANVVKEVNNQQNHEVDGLICPPSIYYVPVVYEDMISFSTRVSSLSPGDVTFVDIFWKPFISRIWIPKLKSEAQDTMYSVPNVHALLLVAQQLFQMMDQMNEFGADLVSVLESTILKFVEDCAAIVRKICEGSLNQIEMSIGASEISQLCHQTQLYQTAKGKVPYQPLAKVTPAEVETKTPREELLAKESGLEAKFNDPSFWTRPNLVKSLLFDSSKISLLSYLSSCCDFVSLHLEEAMEELCDHRNIENLLTNLKSTSWRCSELADECLLFLRREVHLHCFYFLAQLSSDATMGDDAKISTHEAIVALQTNLLAMDEASFAPFLSIAKIALIFDGLDGLVCNYLCNLLSKLPKITKQGVEQIQCNILALQQVLTGLYYKYTTISRDFFHFQRAKRYYNLVLLSETELELYLMENRKAFPSELLRALWRIEVPTRILSKSSVNKLDSLLR
ncbi:exocyst complex component 4 [Thraustotheca clavata]|uniref:Exocyst complex component Sec8 n=1 Tax=Thraustotheca clavata TaxID=74557 RepID=A0A1V9ZWX7_9STRA|nr:exocyst complex component 4 [Thraustotheca clavata]